jgi:hypothetical protein
LTNLGQRDERSIEPSAQTQGIERIEIEGVIKEAFASSELVSYYVGHISSISARLGIERRAFKPLVDGEQEYPVENWAACREMSVKPFSAPWEPSMLKHTILPKLHLILSEKLGKLAETQKPTFATITN